MDGIGLIWTVLERTYLILSIIYFLDYALDGKLDLPHRKIDWEDLRMVQWFNRFKAWIAGKLEEV